ncbi:MAG: hypothetical protein ACYCW6_17495 [Candidatus Xenobia bacterium]
MVLTIALLMLTIGLSLGTMVSLQLNLAGHDSLSRQSELLARAAVAQVDYELNQQSHTQWTQKLDLARQPPINLGLITRFQNQPVFPDALPPGPPGSKVIITFDTSQPCYSTDNSQSPLAASGFLGADKVPPFSVDLIVTTVIGDYTRHYEAIVSETWPYAAYSSTGPMAVTNGCQVQGNVYGGGSTSDSLQLSKAVAVQVGGTSASDTGNNVLGDLATGLAQRLPDPLLVAPGNNVNGRRKYQVSPGSLVSGHAQQGPQEGNLAALLQPPDTSGFTALPLDTSSSVSLGAVNGISSSSTGTISITPTQMLLNGQAVANIFNGPAGPNGSGYWFPSTDQQMFVTSTSTVTTSVTSCVNGTLTTSSVTSSVTTTSLNSSYLANTAFLTAPLVLPASGSGGSYHFTGSLVNRCSWDNAQVGTQGCCGLGLGGGPGQGCGQGQGPGPGSPPPGKFRNGGGHGGGWPVAVGAPPAWCTGLPCLAAPAGCNKKYMGTGTYMLSTNGTLTLNNVVLVVDQDLDVAGIQGDASVLIVGGRLTLTGGRLDAKDKGIVIQAGHVILRGTSGDFRGLIVSQGTLQTLSTPGAPHLKVRGGLISGDSMSLSGTDVTRDPKYLAPVNRYGSFQVAMFRGLEE